VHTGLKKQLSHTQAFLGECPAFWNILDRSRRFQSGLEGEGADPGTAYVPTALPTVGPYELPVPETTTRNRSRRFQSGLEGEGAPLFSGKASVITDFLGAFVLVQGGNNGSRGLEGRVDPGTTAQLGARHIRSLLGDGTG
jgi:hypothetical protein